MRLEIKTAAESFLDVLVQKPTHGEIGVFTLISIPAGALIVPLLGTLSDRASKMTVQVDDTVHLDESEHIVAGVNHSCEPNAFLDFSDPDRFCIRALKPIAVGAEVTIDYCASEEALAEPFECWCGSENCYGTVRGYAFLDFEERSTLAGSVSPYLQKKYQKLM